jgi:hypothetical protein
MSDDFLTFCDAEPVDTGFVPTVRIARGGNDVFTWRCQFAFTDMASALVYGRDYAEVALAALKVRGQR